MLERGNDPGSKTPHRLEAGTFPVTEPGAANGFQPPGFVNAGRYYGSPETCGLAERARVFPGSVVLLRLGIVVASCAADTA